MIGIVLKILGIIVLSIVIFIIVIFEILFREEEKDKFGL